LAPTKRREEVYRSGAGNISAEAPRMALEPECASSKKMVLSHLPQWRTRLCSSPPVQPQRLFPI